MDVATHYSEMQKSLENNLELLYLKDLDNLQNLRYVGLNRYVELNQDDINMGIKMQISLQNI